MLLVNLTSHLLKDCLQAMSDAVLIRLSCQLNRWGLSSFHWNLRRASHGVLTKAFKVISMAG